MALENQIKKIKDSQLRAKFLVNKKFINQNFQKCSKSFLNFNRAYTSKVDIDSIKKKVGIDQFQEFDNDAERYTYIRNTFQSLYDEKSVNDTSIEDFLGDEGCQYFVNNNLFVSNVEKEYFEKEITLKELDEAMKSANKNSAGGPDNISNQFLTLAWN